MDGRTDSPPDPVGDRTASTSTTAAVLAHPAVQRVIGALGAHHVYAEVTVLGGAARTAAQAAAYLGVSPAQIANSLVFAVRDRPGTSLVPLLVLTSGPTGSTRPRSPTCSISRRCDEPMPSSSG